MGNISVNDIIQKRKQKWIDLYDGKINSVILIGRGDCGNRPLPYSENKAGRIEYALRKYRVFADSVPYVDDDRIPFLEPYTGTEIFAHAFGCDVSYPANDMPFALPFVHNPKELAKVRYPELQNSSVMEMFEIADKLKSAEPGGLLSLPDIQSPLDIAALIWNKEDLFIYMYDDPKAVMELVDMTEKFLTEFLDLWFARYGKDFIAHHPEYYMPYGVTFSEDEVGAISPAMFNEFSLGSLNRLSDRYGAAGMHCCAHSYHQWESFKLIKNLRLINLNLNQYEPTQKAYVYFKDTCVQMHSSGNVDESVVSGHKSIRTVIQDWADSTESASEKGKLWRTWEEKFTKN